MHLEYLRKYKALAEDLQGLSNLSLRGAQATSKSPPRRSLLQLPLDIVKQILDVLALDSGEPGPWGEVRPAGGESYQNLFAFSLTCQTACHEAKPCLTKKVAQIHHWGGNRVVLVGEYTRPRSYAPTLRLSEEECHEVEAY